MRIYNEQTKQVEEFKPLVKNQVKMYVCGPTVYNHIHIGNARPIIFFDFVKRVFELNGYDVMYVSNITDVDDKIINQAKVDHTTEKELVKKNLEQFSEILNKLDVKYTKQPLVTQTMDQIIEFIKLLVNNNHAYVVDGDVYFDITSIDDYGMISNLKIEDNKQDTRIESNDKKKNPNDFTLWKKTDDGIKWESPWSKGRPGWHTECVVMIRDILGDKIDIHGGGIDLQFPHHENENAQSLACGDHLANYWMHNGFININNEKMSKSIGNVMLAKAFINNYGQNVLRLVMFQSNYRQPININDEFINSCIRLNDKLNNYYQKVNTNAIDFNLGKIKKIVNNDFDTPNLITYLLQVIKTDEMDNQVIFNTIIYLLGLSFNKEELKEIPNEVLELLELRNKYKQEKDYQKADEVRDQINNLGYEIKDTREGSICVEMEK